MGQVRDATPPAPYCKQGTPIVRQPSPPDLCMVPPTTVSFCPLLPHPRGPLPITASLSNRLPPPALPSRLPPSTRQWLSDFSLLYHRTGRGLGVTRGWREEVLQAEERVMKEKGSCVVIVSSPAPPNPRTTSGEGARAGCWVNAKVSG